MTVYRSDNLELLDLTDRHNLDVLTYEARVARVIPPAVATPPAITRCGWLDCKATGIDGWCNDHSAFAMTEAVMSIAAGGKL